MSDTIRQRLDCLLLAAGQAERFGSPKQLAKLEGQTLIERAAQLADTVIDGTRIAVVGAYVKPILEPLAATRCACLYNADWQQGPGTSIAAGVRGLPSHSSGVLLWQVDQARLTVDDLKQLIDAWRRTPTHIVAAHYADTVGPPVIFPRRLYDALQTLPAAHGAKALLLKDRQVSTIDLPSAAMDIDTPDDLAAAQQWLQPN